ncbi:AcrR family transcriptional regulator [Leptospira perolatii]|uniref:AcrR family transcriptional regulator n=1 Tax=Leptospira perolatii TaxID=2023191 RepID=A0A2M9ZLR4_9LEPT|nr:TetR/AcrR family transcriptional regulator [Leptospira perolatii]PJZ69830.1 AcrR family transcriptional regulator [Leptospira perolatii]PJZ72955.1 AcrR family transcriptional regulator [Leptospira perolatii]
MRKKDGSPVYPTNGNFRNSRERILEGAAIAFARKGFHGTSLREISRECGLEQPSIYHHFHSKENLFRKALVATHLMILNDIRSRIEKEQGLREEIVSVFKAISNIARQFPDRARLPFSLVYSAPENLVLEYTNHYGAQYRKLLEASFERNPPAKNPELKLSLLVDLLHSLILSVSSEKFFEDRVNGIEERVDFILSSDETD